MKNSRDWWKGAGVLLLAAGAVSWLSQFVTGRESVFGFSHAAHAS